MRPRIQLRRRDPPALKCARDFAPHRFSARGTGACGFYAGPNVEWSVEKYPVDQANSWFADPYALLGFKLGYRTKKGFSFFFEAKNLTDKVYAATTGVIADTLGADNANFLPGTGRAFYGGIEWRW